MNIARLAVDNIDKYGEYVSTYYEDASFTNVQRYDHACRLASVLLGHGVKPGDRVVVMMLNCPEVLSAFTAIWKIGAIIIPITPMWNAREVRYVIEDSGAQIVITSPELASRLLEASREIHGFREVLVTGETAEPDAVDISGEIEQAGRYEPLADMEGSDLALLLYTSGTTGNPKGVMLSHENLLFITDSVYRLNEHLPHVRGIQVLPLSHVYGILIMNLGSRMGSTGRILRHFDALEVLKTIEELKVERMSVVPTMLTLLINHPDREKYDTSSLVQVSSGGAPLQEGTRVEFSKLFNCRVVQGYGLSESSGALTGYHPDADYRLGSVGPALPGIEICVMDFDNRILPAGETGEICSRGPHVMQGYYRNPEATSSAIVDGWLHTGDVGYLDADGYVYITDRRKDLVIKGGENISPREIEEGIYSHPAVSEAAVFGIPDPIYGENLMATVVLKPGLTLTEHELKAHLAGYVTKFKVPERIVFLDNLPKNASGKILKRELKERFTN